MWIITYLMSNKKLIGIGFILLLLAGLLFYVNGLKSEINILNAKILRLQRTIEKQKIVITDITDTKESLSKDLAKLRAMKPKVKYRTIEKIREVKSDDCEQIKNILEEIRDIKFDDL